MLYQLSYLADPRAEARGPHDSNRASLPILMALALRYYLVGVRTRRTFCATIGLVALLSSGAAPISASAASGAPMITIFGRSGGYVDLVLDRFVTVKPSAMKADTSGDFTGFVVTRPTPANNVEVVSGAIWVPAFEELQAGSGTVSLMEQGLGPSEGALLTPGIYRIHLLADAPSRVHIPVSGLARSIRLRTKVQASTEGGVEQLGAPPLPTEMHRSVRRTGNSLTVMAVLASVDDPQAFFVEHCFLKESDDTDPALCRPDQVQSSWGPTGGSSFGSTGRRSDLIVRTFLPGRAQAGSFVAHQRVLDAATSGVHIGLIIDADLSVPPYPDPPDLLPPLTLSMDYTPGGLDPGVTCGLNVAGVWVFLSCGGFPSRSTDRFVAVEIVDALGGPVAGKLFTGTPNLEGVDTHPFCGSSGTLPIEPEGFAFLQVYSHPTTYCPTGHGTAGQAHFTFSHDGQS